MTLQMAARTVLAEATIWAFSTLLLVWFWVSSLPAGGSAVLQALVVLVALREGHSAPLP
jgi:hypothetical protein